MIRGEALGASRVHPAELLRLGSMGLRTRRLRASLSALGIAIGIAAMVAVLGVSESSRANLIAQLNQLGTNLLTVTPGNTFLGQTAVLPHEAPSTIGRLATVQGVSSTAVLQNVTVRRTDQVPMSTTSGLSVRWTDTSLLRTLNGSVYRGQWLNSANGHYPAVVLGWVAAQRLGLVDLEQPTQVYLGDRWFTVVGVLQSLPLAPEIDRSVLIGLPVAEAEFLADDSPDTVYVRSDPDRVLQTRDLLPKAANPAHPEEVNVSRPSDALAARAAAQDAFTSLFVGLGAVALLVGGVGIANVMVISVLERRSEIGLRRALGATRRLVAVQFLAESLLLSMLGGVGGVAIGTAATAAYAQLQSLPAVVPPIAVVGGLAAALGVGAIAGLYPANRAARLSPTEALRTV
ncbi:MAG TPA: ABC transporter permease [Candidatus Dormibacteraeota bacterium]|nr:ABC transporter permease [Candidatus Dormibacteraeota bacterium]